jgi:hypothetical protein
VGASQKIPEQESMYEMEKKLDCVPKPKYTVIVDLIKPEIKKLRACPYGCWSVDPSAVQGMTTDKLLLHLFDLLHISTHPERRHMDEFSNNSCHAACLIDDGFHFLMLLLPLWLPNF